MATRRQFIALAGAAVLALVGGTILYRRNRGAARTTVQTSSTSGGGTGVHAILGAMHFPTTLESPAFSDPKSDNLFTDMLSAMGVEMVAFEWDYQVFSDSRWNARLQSAYDYARGKGLKTHIINQMQPSFWSAGGINPPPASATSNIDQFQGQIVSAYAQLRPDYLSVVAEPSNLQQKFKFSYSASKWASLVGALVGGIPSGTSPWVDLVPNSGFDMGLISSLVGVGGLDGIGMDLYGASEEPAVQSRLATITDAGKKWGLSETWWGPLYADPSLDVASNAPQMASWFSASYSWASQNGCVMYNPFFTNLFVQDPRQVDYDYADLTAYFSQQLSLLQAGRFTTIHDAYAELISSMK